MLHIITNVKVQDNYKLTLTFADGETRTVDFASLIRQGGVFSPLADPQFFSQVQISEDGRYITWPGELDFCADALRVQASAAVGSQ